MTKTNDEMAREILKVLEGLSGNAAVIELAALLQSFRDQIDTEAFRQGYDEAYEEAYDMGYNDGCIYTEDRLDLKE